MNKNIIAIDGPAAAGKGTLSKQICNKYDFISLDTGSLYRAITVALIESDFFLAKLDAPVPEITTDKVAVAVKLAEELAHTHKILDYAKNPEIRSKTTNKYVPIVAKIPEIRAVMKAYQRQFVENPPLFPDGRTAKGVVIEGRDIGSVICPDAPLKFYITASAEARAKRRLKEFIDQGEVNSTFDEILASIKARDEMDMNRPNSPLKPAQDAIIIDTTDFDVSQTFDKVDNFIKQRLDVSL